MPVVFLESAPNNHVQEVICSRLLKAPIPKYKLSKRSSLVFARRFCLINWKNTYTKNLLGQKYQTRQVHRLLAEPKPWPVPKQMPKPKPWPKPKQMPNVEAFGLKYWCTRSPHLFRFSNQRCWEPSEIHQKQIIEIQNSIVQNFLELNMKIPPNSLNFNNKEAPWNTIGLRIPGFSWALPFC